MEDIEFPRSIILKKAGITYTEEGPNVVYLNIVKSFDEEKDKDMICLIGTIDQSDLANQFSAMTFGKLLYSMPLVEFLDRLTMLENAPEDYVEND